jgi:(p)ppGpp synthase/HD superfamily hydrolase
MSIRIETAEDFANEAHAGQVRKYTGEPYFNHVYKVAQDVLAWCEDENIYMAALLHDVVEDTEVTGEDIFNLFGEEIAELVYELTDHFTKENYPHLNRAERKKLEADRMSKIPQDAKLIKYCDIADNAYSILEHDLGFAPVFLRECADLISAMNSK